MQAAFGDDYQEDIVDESESYNDMMYKKMRET